jgi:hypothetical protein
VTSSALRATVLVRCQTRSFMRSYEASSSVCPLGRELSALLVSSRRQLEAIRALSVIENSRR